MHGMKLNEITKINTVFSDVADKWLYSSKIRAIVRK
jgi:hypothetical protein